ncbi:DUF6299 family protein [Streptomyces sp. NPDC017979]|uniref:DUF6299 family protein n=1 Tax=Streptomyces sp. NPDC017979 TaxID=3365024 RepID=UPI0037AB32E1
MINARRGALLTSLTLAAALATGLTPGTASAQFAPDTLTVDSVGRLAEDGVVTLTGTYRCSSLRTDPVLIGVKALQGSTRADTGGAAATCDDRVHTWSSSGRPHSGAFAPGSARGEAAMIELDLSGGLPLPHVITYGEKELTLRR